MLSEVAGAVYRALPDYCDQAELKLLYNCTITDDSVEVVVDTSVLIAVLLGEPSRAALIWATKGADLLAPGSVHWEVGNALVALTKRRVATRAQAIEALRGYGEIPIRFVDVDLAESVDLATEYGLYAYDAYLLACAKNRRAPLLTLDKALMKAGRGAGVKVLEVDE